MKKRNYLLLITALSLGLMIGCDGNVNTSTNETIVENNEVIEEEIITPNEEIEEEIIEEIVQSDSYLALHSYYDYYCLYPNNNTANIVESIVATLNDKGLAGELSSYVCKDSPDIESIKKLISSTEWKEAYFLGNGTLSASYLYEDENGLIKFSTDSTQTIIYISVNGCIYSYNITAEGSDFYSEDSTGLFTSLNYSPEDDIIQKVSGTVADGICTGTITIEKDGVIYTGELDSNGQSTITQKNKKKTIYAQSEDGKKSLYASCKASELIISPDYLNIYTGNRIFDGKFESEASIEELTEFEQSLLEDKSSGSASNNSFNFQVGNTTDIEKEATAASKPATTQTPSTQESTPEPAPSQNSGGSSGGSSPSVSDPAPSQPSQDPAPASPDPSPSTSSGDGEDLDWTEDVL